MKLSGVILAGGQGLRMGGADKGLVDLAQRPLIAWISQTLSPWVDKVYISCNRNMDEYRAYGECFGDETEGFLGPLAGLLSASRRVPTTHFIVLPCDGPLVSEDCIRRLVQAAQQYELVVAHDGERLQPLYGIYPVNLAGSIKQALDQGRRGLQRWLKTQDYHQVDMSDLADDLLNINQPEDLRQAQNRIIEKWQS